MKIDHKSHKPLLSEIRFYISVLDPLAIDNWTRERGIKYLAIPDLYGIGETDDYRFFVIKNLGRVFAPKDTESSIRCMRHYDKHVRVYTLSRIYP
ncbi:ser/thr protein kinase-like protein [Taterapox virus]|uniref:Ser/thr protein kinase-like protein n=1 Tax=Taterapox virus TaxID=28871 RepID=Q0NP12_9POXV|nr:ser/thr protein kinase-like protein [Taterapox virus]ABD97765.1 ser/thr protein kinase-like protein [Taterapox virus]